jgi:hypothetical protein
MLRRTKCQATILQCTMQLWNESAPGEALLARGRDGDLPNFDANQHEP